MTGANTVTVWLHVAVLVPQSAACQVRVIICGLIPLVIVFTIVTTLLPHEPPATVGLSNIHAVPHSAYLSPAQWMKSGRGGGGAPEGEIHIASPTAAIGVLGAQANSNSSNV